MPSTSHWTGAVAAGRWILAAVESVTRDAGHATSGVPDEAERQAIVRAGPAPDVWRSVQDFLFAASVDSDEARQLMKSTFSNWARARSGTDEALSDDRRRWAIPWPTT